MTNEKILDDVADLQEEMDAQNAKAYPPPEPGYRRYPGPAAFEIFRLQQYRDEANRTEEHRMWVEEHCGRLETQWKSVAESLKRIADHLAPAKDESQPGNGGGERGNDDSS